MNQHVQIAQAGGSSTANNQAPLRIYKLTKPLTDQSVVVNLGYDQKAKIDFTSIANEKVTLVHIGEKLIILFDNKSTVTVEPFFASRQDGLNNVTIEVAPGRDVSANEFASIFPITTDQSVLPAAGNGDGGNSQATGAHFTDPSVDALSVGNPLDLLGQEQLGNFVVEFPLVGSAPVNNAIPTVAVIPDFPDASFNSEASEAGLPLRTVNGIAESAGSGELAASGGSGNDDASETARGVFNITTGNDSLRTLLVGGVDVTAGGTVTGAHGILTVTLSDGVYHYTYTLTDHTSGDTTSDNFNVVVTDSDGDSASTSLVINIIDDVPAAHDDHGIQAAENASVVVDVKANDVPGADGVNWNGVTHTAPQNGAAAATGTLVDNHDGTFTYTPGAGEE
jgi:VCBS repeat-containing protein